MFFLSSGQSSHTSCDKVAGTAENPSPSKSHASDQVTPRTPGPEAPWRLLEGAAPDLGILGARLAAIVRSIVSLDTHLLRKGMSRNICSRCNGCEFQGRSHRSETWETKPILTRDTQKPLRGFLRRWEGDDAVSVTPPDVISGDTQRTNTGVQLNRVIEQGLPAQERGMTVIVSLQSWSFDLSFLLFLVRNSTTRNAQHSLALLSQSLLAGVFILRLPERSPTLWSCLRFHELTKELWLSILFLISSEAESLFVFVLLLRPVPIRLFI